MTVQEVYDHLVQASRDGLFPSLKTVNGDEVCAYRGDGGRRCGVGLFIPDDKYDPAMEEEETSGWRVIHSRFPEAAAALPDCLSHGDWVLVQATHDENPKTPWDHSDFVRSLNRLGCFRTVKQVNE